MLAKLAATLLLIGMTLAPAASAWNMAPAAVPPASSDLERVDAAWTVRFARQLPGEAVGQLAGAATCALGDVNGDGVGDLLTQVHGAAGDPTALIARAGPDFQKILWQQVSKAERVLECAADLDLDGIADPVLRTVGDATAGGAAAAGVAQDSVQMVLQTLDGGSGIAMIGRVATDTATGVAGGAAGPAIAAGETATSVLLPAAQGAAAFVQTTVKGAQIVSLPAGLPVAALTSTLETTAQVDVLGVTGEVVASIEVGAAGEQIMAIAPVPLLGGVPNVAVLTQQVVSPVEEVAAQVPTLAMYAADGTLAWSTELAASTGVAMLIPQAGDLDLDGVPDLVVETLQQGVETAPAAAFQVLSGVDGSVIFSSGEAVMGLVAALPLGMLPTGDALLQVERAAGAASMTISALGEGGATLWSATVDPLAEPVNAALDAYTGDIVGFTDLTGDGLPDVGTMVRQGSNVAMQVIDGATGQVAWAQQLADVGTVMPMVLDVGRSAVQQASSGAETALVTIGNATTPTITMIEATTGQIQWVAQAVPDVAASFNLSVQAAGDLDADGVQDLLVTAMDQAMAGAATAAEQTATVIALSGQTGLPLYMNTTSTADVSAGLQLTATPGPAFRAAPERAATGEAQSSPTPVAALVAVALLGLALLRRRPLAPR